MKNPWIQLHLAIFLFGATAVFGKLLSNDGFTGFVVVWWRMLFTAFFLCLIPKMLSSFRTLPKSTILKIAGIGILVSLHWVLFYASVRAANVSVTLSCLATNALFTCLLEPIIFRRAIVKFELLLSLMVIPGMGLIMSFIWKDYALGILLGLGASFLSALFSTLNKAIIKEASAVQMTGIQIISGFGFLCLVFPLYLFVGIEEVPKVALNTYDFLLFLGFSSLCTVLPFILSVSALRHISAFSANLAFNLEPVYGVAFGIFIFNENKVLDIGFYIGLALVLFAVGLHPFLHKRFSPSEHTESLQP